MLFICPPFQFSNQVTDFHETWFQRFVLGGYPIDTLIDFRYSITIWRRREPLTLEQYLIYGYKIIAQ
jgi:hypothetical protein